MPEIYRTIVVRNWPVGLLLIAMCMIQGGAALAKTIFPIAGPGGTVSVRLILSALILVIVFRPWTRPTQAGAWRSIIIYGLALGTMNFLFYEAFARIPLGIAVALEFTGPLMVALFSSRRVFDLLWISLAVVGLGILLWPRDGDVSSSLDWVGVLCALGAGGCWALYILFGQKAGSLNGMHSAVLGIIVAAIVVSPIGIMQAGAALLNPTVLAVGLGVAVLSTAVPYMLEMIALPRLPTTTFGTLMSLEPSIGALSGLLFLGQALSLLQWFAISAVMIASIGTILTPGRRNHPGETKSSPAA